MWWLRRYYWSFLNSLCYPFFDYACEQEVFNQIRLDQGKQILGGLFGKPHCLDLSGNGIFKLARSLYSAVDGKLLVIYRLDIPDASGVLDQKGLGRVADLSGHYAGVCTIYLFGKLTMK